MLFCICTCTGSNYEIIHKMFVLTSFPDSPQDLAWPWGQPAPPPYKNSPCQYHCPLIDMASCRQSKLTWGQGQFAWGSLPLLRPLTHCRLAYIYQDPFLLLCSENCSFVPRPTPSPWVSNSQFLITCSMQKRREWSWIGVGDGLGMRPENCTRWVSSVSMLMINMNIIPMATS